MADADWTADGARVIGMFLNGDAIAGKDGTGNAIVDDSFLLYFNGGADDVELTLPPAEYAPEWDVAIDTAADGPEAAPLAAGAARTLAGSSALVLIEHANYDAEPEMSAAASVAAMIKIEDEETNGG